MLIRSVIKMPPCLDVAADVCTGCLLSPLISCDYGQKSFISSQVLLGCCAGEDVFSSHCYLSVISAFPVSHGMSNEEG